MYVVSNHHQLDTVATRMSIYASLPIYSPSYIPTLTMTGELECAEIICILELKSGVA